MVNRTIPKMAGWVVSTVMTVSIPTWVHADKQISTYYEGVGSTPVKLVAQAGNPLQDLGHSHHPPCNHELQNLFYGADCVPVRIRTPKRPSKNP